MVDTYIRVVYVEGILHKELRMVKTSKYQKKAVRDSHKKKMQEGSLCYKRYIKPDWKEQLDQLLTKLKRETKDE